MTKKIFKYAIDHEVTLPASSQIVHASSTHIWVSFVEGDTKTRNVKFIVVGTGQYFDDEYKHLHTWFDGPFVWHLLYKEVQ